LQYGIWLTLSSVIVWFSFFDVGFGQGLKNKLIEAITAGDNELAKTYVSTTFFSVAIISFTVLTAILVVNPFLNWAQLLNAPAALGNEIARVVIIIFVIFSFQFVLQIINTIAIANQNVIIPSVINFLGSLLGLILIFVFTKTVHGSLTILALSLGVSPLLVLVFFNLFLFQTRFKAYSPSIRYFKLMHAKEILMLGIKFFFIQIGLLFFYNIDNILISRIVGPKAVTAYNVAYRYFGVITMLSGIILTPFWGAFAEANLRKDFIWIKSSVNRLQKIVGLIALLGLIMLGLSPLVYKLWIGKTVIIPFALSAVLCLYTVFNTFRTIFIYYMNGVSKLNIQIIIVFVSGMLNIPLGILLGRHFGTTGVILATTLLCICCGFVEVTQYNLLINNKAKGIWNK